MSTLSDQYRATVAAAAPAPAPAAPVAEPSVPSEGAAVTPVPPPEVAAPPSPSEGTPLETPAEAPAEPVAEGAPTDGDPRKVDVMAKWEARVRREMAAERAEHARVLAAERERVAVEVKQQWRQALKQNPVAALRAEGYSDDEIVQMSRDGFYGIIGPENAPKEYTDAMALRKLELEIKKVQTEHQTWVQQMQEQANAAEKLRASQARLAEATDATPYVRAEFAADPQKSAADYLAFVEAHHAAGNLDGFRTMGEARKWLLNQYDGKIANEVMATKTRHPHAFGTAVPPRKPTTAAAAPSSPSVPSPTRPATVPKTPVEMEQLYRTLKRK